MNDIQKAVLVLLSNALFKKNKELNVNLTWKEISEEGRQQKIITLLYSEFEKNNEVSEYRGSFFRTIANNIRIDNEHKKLHEVMCQNNIPYVVLKGCASAVYYPEPLLRIMGDVDFLVNAEDFDKADKLLRSMGFIAESECKGRHLGYTKKDEFNNSLWEMHRQVNGIPTGDIGKIVTEYLADTIDTAVMRETDNGGYMLPDTFHHGLILLLHTATHITSEGVGLRHLCDWAVFVGGISDNEFTELFEEKLKKIGLWRFAQILTQCSVKYLGCPNKSWVGKSDKKLLDGIMEDIFGSGDFGKKDYDRYRQIKYISNRGEHTVDDKNTFSQVLSSLNKKTKKQFPITKKAPVLLPLCWLVVLFRYLILLLSRKRKVDSVSTIKNASLRKNIYKEFELFDV